MFSAGQHSSSLTQQTLHSSSLFSQKQDSKPNFPQTYFPLQTPFIQTLVFLLHSRKFSLCDG
jgi:hypothetical protein